jgi:pyruvate/2-oxoglutarate dehydrogenase complex dihydrolipoamide dehydrogenase (E3) component
MGLHMAGIQHYDNLILGSGEASKYLAWTFAKCGQRTAVIERELIGGSCPNIACLPSKNIIHSAKVASLCGQAGEFGVSTGPLAIDMNAVRERKRRMVDSLVETHLTNYNNSGAELIMGDGRFLDARTIEVRLNAGGASLLRGERVFLSTGTRPNVPEAPGLAQAKPLTHVEALDLDRVPRHLIILGGGYVGLEFAQAMRRFGSRVTIVQRGPQLASREDPDVGTALLEMMQSEEIEVLLGSATVSVEGVSGDTVRVQVNHGGSKRVIEGSDLLVATGRTPNTHGIGLESASVEVDAKGYIKVNDRLETTAPQVWAVGECAGSPQFTHVAFDDFRIVRDNLGGGNRSTRGRIVPFCMFTDPQLARVGLNETEAKRAGVQYRIASMPMAAVLRTRTISETRGFLKMLIDQHSDQILGFTAFGAEAAELMSVVQTAMLGRMPFPILRDGIFTHPTMAEGLTVLLADVESVAG